MIYSLHSFITQNQENLLALSICPDLMMDQENSNNTNNLK
jgi:hypothetical protein